MTIKRYYFGIENIALTAPQKATLVAALQTLGIDNQAPQPSDRNHWRVRLDGNAVIFCAAFDDSTITVAAFQQYLATIFSVPVGSITTSTITPTFKVIPSAVVTFTYASTDYLRVCLFGGLAASRDQSNVEVLGYLYQNAAAWGEIVS